MPAERLQKLLARAGVGSRRGCEEIVLAGRVSVDGRVVTELGTRADPETQDVRLDGSRLKAERPEYWLLNKPKGVVCTNFDPAGRPRPIDLMARLTRARLFAVGRLDADSRGALLMTNDGELANRLTHPRYEVPKTYLATVGGDVTSRDVHRLLRGVYLSEGPARVAQVRILRRSRSRSTLAITLREGRNRHIRRTLARLGHNVRELVRTRVGRISLHGLPSGQARRLTADEVEYLKKIAQGPPADEGRQGRRPRGERRGAVLSREPQASARPAAAPPARARGRGPHGRAPSAERRESRFERGGRKPGREGRGRSFGDKRERGSEGRDFRRREDGERGFQRERGSRPKHDADGMGKGREGDRRDARGGRGRGPRRRDRPPPRGRGPDRRPPE
jgi:23S rRNA pseudouridine2605 synthase